MSKYNPVYGYDNTTKIIVHIYRLVNVDNLVYSIFLMKIINSFVIPILVVPITY